MSLGDHKDDVRRLLWAAAIFTALLSYFWLHRWDTPRLFLGAPTLGLALWRAAVDCKALRGLRRAYWLLADVSSVALATCAIAQYVVVVTYDAWAVTQTFWGKFHEPAMSLGYTMFLTFLALGGAWLLWSAAALVISLIQRIVCIKSR